MMKKGIFLTLVFIMLFSFTALANDENIVTENVEQTQEIDVMPRYNYIGFITVCLTIDENGLAEYDCSARAPYRNVRMKLYLQRSRNQVVWDEVILTFKTVYDSGAISKTYDLSPNDYFYRAKVTVEVLDSNGDIIETETVYSDTKRY